MYRVIIVCLFKAFYKLGELLFVKECMLRKVKHESAA